MFSPRITTAPGTDVPATPENDQSVARLVTGIVDDAQELLRQQIALLKHEVRKDLRDARQLSISFVACAGLALMAGVMFCFMLVNLLSWLWPAIPLWGSFAIFGGVFGLAALALGLVAKEKLEDLAPSEETQEAIKENLQWTRKPR